MKKINSIMGYGLWISVLLFVSLSINAQPQQYNTAMQPQATFQSTSTMRASGSAYSSTPMINANGMAVYQGSSEPTPAYSPAAGPKKLPPLINGTPLGDAMWPLLLMALAYAAYCAVRLYRRKRRV